MQGLEVGNTKQKFVYGLFLILGILFFVASLSTFYSMYSLIQNVDPLFGISIKKLVLFSLYIILNFIVGYGLVFCKRWIIPLLGFNAGLMGLTALYSQFVTSNQVNASATTSAFCISFVLLSITYLLRKYLNDSSYKKSIDVLYISLLLITFIVTYLI